MMWILQKFLPALLIAVTLVPLSAEAQEKAERRYQCRSFADHPFGHLQSLWQGTDGVFYREASDFNSDYYFTEEQLDAFERLSKALKSQGVTLVFSITPTRGMALDQGYKDLLGKEIDYDRELAASRFRAALTQLEDRGIVAPDILAAYDAYDGEDYLYYATDHHWSPLGAREAAKAVGEKIRTLPAFDGLTTYEFETRQDGDFNAVLNMKEEIAAYCGLENFEERYPLFVTAKVSSDADDLFGDAPEPEIVLVGTSYSGVENFNFAGFLQQATGLEVDNRAMNGGSLNHALRQYLTSDDFHDSPPSFLIWEIPGYFNYYYRFGPRLMRQSVPAVAGACDGAELAKSVGKSGETRFSLKVPAGVEASGSGYYLHVRSNAEVNAIALLLSYRNDLEESIVLPDGFRGQYSGNFYWELAPDMTGPLGEITLDRPDEGTVGGMELSLCRNEDQL